MGETQRAGRWIGLSVALYSIVILVDRFAFGRPAFTEGIPLLMPGQWMLTALLLLAAAALVRGTLLLAPQGAAAGELIVAWSRNDRWASMLSMATHLAFVALLLISPVLFNSLVLEDQPVENASALFWFIAWALSLIAALRLHRQPNHSKRQVWLLLGLSALFFLSGMEEVSWFQRVFHVQTPAALERVNMQGELNLHNIATHPTENVFYNGMVVLLVLIPALQALRVIRLERWGLGLSIPRPYLVVVGVLATAWNFNKWDIPLFQYALFVSVLLTIALARRSASSADRAMLLAAASASIAGQAIFLIFGDHFIRDWDVTEYRELLMPLGCLMWAGNVFAATRSFVAPKGANHTSIGHPSATALRTIK